MKKLSILIPVYNSEKTIGPLCEALISFFSNKYNLEIVLVNDGSKDNSDEICRQLHLNKKEIITYIKLAKNFGEHNALMAGLNYVTGDYCVIMADDFQNPPEEVIKLYDEIQKGFDVVYSYYHSKKYSRFKILGSTFNDKVANVMLNKPKGLYLSSFKIMNRFVVNEIIKYTGPYPYVDGIILRSTTNIGRVLVEHRRREHDTSGYTLKKLLSLWGNMFVNFSILPLRIMGLLGGGITLISLIIGIYTIVNKLLNPEIQPGWTSLITAILFFGGVQLVSLSIVGEYIGRAFLFLNKEPQFVIRDSLPSERRNNRK